MGNIYKANFGINSMGALLQLLAGLPEETARKAIGIVHKLDVQTTEGFATISEYALKEAGADDTTIQHLTSALGELNITLRTAKISLDEFLGKLPEDSRTEVSLFLELEKLDDPEMLTRYASETLKERGMKEDTINALEATLKEYDLVLQGTSSGILRNYAVVNCGDHLMVNSVRIPSPATRGRNALQLKDLQQLYEMHSQGADPKKIAKQIKRGEQTIIQKLRWASVIPQVKSHGFYRQSARTVPRAGRRTHSTASGAPPGGPIQYRSPTDRSALIERSKKNE